MGLGKRISILLVVAALLGAAGYVTLRYFSIDAVREVVVQRLEALTGRDIEVTGDFDLVPSLVPTVAAEGIIVANVPWGSRPMMLTADRIEVELQALPLLLEGELRIERLELIGAELLLETGREGRANWQFDAAGAEEAVEPGRVPFLLDEVLIQDSRLAWHDMQTGRTETVAIDRFTWQADDVTSALTLEGTGAYRSRPLMVSGELGSIQDLLGGGADPYPIALRATLGTIEARIKGEVSPRYPEGETRLEVTLAGEALAGLGGLLEADLPPLGPYRLEAVIASAGGGLMAKSLQATIGGTETALLRVQGCIDELLAGAGIRLQVEAEGTVGALGELLEVELPALGPYTLAGTLTGSLDRLALMDLTGRLGEKGILQVRLTKGHIERLLAGKGLELWLEAEGPRVAALGALLGMDLPTLGAYAFEGKLTGSMEVLALVNLTGAVGEGGAVVLRVRDGVIANVLTGEGIRVSLQSEGESLAAVAEMAGFELAPFGPYTFEGTLLGRFDDLALTSIVATAGDRASRVSMTGTVDELLEARELELAVELEGTNLAALSPLVGFGLPPSEPYRLAGRITGSPRDLRIEGIKARVADSVITGWLSVERPESGTPWIKGELLAERFDLDRVLAMARAAGDEQQAAGARAGGPATTETAASGGGGLFPDAPLPLDALNALRADLMFRAEELVFKGAELRSARAHLVLRDGRLSLRDITMQVADGAVSGDLVVEAERPVAEVVVRLNVNDIKVAQLMTDLGAASRNVRGEVDIDINIDSTGRSIDALMGELEGSAAVVVEEGRIEDVPLNLLVPDLDILHLLPPFWLAGNDDVVRVNCLVGEFEIDEGVARAEALLDTRRMTLFGKGTVHLGKERLDLALRPVPKGGKLSTAAVPIDIEGRLARPEIDPRLAAVAGQAIRGILGGLLIPLNQIAALFGQETADACTDALEQARQRRAARSKAGAVGSDPAGNGYPP